MKNRKVKTVKSLAWQLSIGGGAILLSLVLCLLAIFYLATEPYRQAKTRLYHEAESRFDIKKVDSFYLMDGRKGSASLILTDQKGKQKVLIQDLVNQSYQTYDLEKVITKEKALEQAKKEGASQIDQIKLGLRDGQAIWEVRSKTTYYYLPLLKEKS